MLDAVRMAEPAAVQPLLAEHALSEAQCALVAARLVALPLPAVAVAPSVAEPV
jgi:hypothetical protein